MRNKTIGLTRLEVAKLQNSKPLPLNQTVELLNAPERTRLQTEQVIKSVKHLACQHILNYELNRPSVSNSDFRKLLDLVNYASRIVGIDIYSEYKEEYLFRTRGRAIPIEAKSFVCDTYGMQTEYAYASY